MFNEKRLTGAFHVKFFVRIFNALCESFLLELKLNSKLD